MKISFFSKFITTWLTMAVIIRVNHYVPVDWRTAIGKGYMLLVLRMMLNINGSLNGSGWRFYFLYQEDCIITYFYTMYIIITSFAVSSFYSYVN